MNALRCMAVLSTLNILPLRSSSSYILFGTGFFYGAIWENRGLYRKGIWRRMCSSTICTLKMHTLHITVRCTYVKSYKRVKKHNNTHSSNNLKLPCTTNTTSFSFTTFIHVIIMQCISSVWLINNGPNTS